MLALCCSPSLRHLHKGCIDTVFSTTGILANTVALWRPCGSILISCAPHSAPPFVELLAKVTPGFTNQPDCPIHCCCRLKRVRAHSHTHTHTEHRVYTLRGRTACQSFAYNSRKLVAHEGKSKRSNDDKDPWLPCAPLSNWCVCWCQHSHRWVLMWVMKIWKLNSELPVIPAGCQSSSYLHFPPGLL